VPRKTFICGRKVKKGVSGDDSAYLGDYLELGWELLYIRLKMIRLLQEGEYQNEVDCVVTGVDRNILYEPTFKNITNVLPEEPGEVVDLVSMIAQNTHSSFFETLSVTEGRYSFWDQDYSLITSLPSIEHSFFDQGPFSSVLIRLRDHCKDRQLGGLDYWKSVLDTLGDQTRLVVLGQGVEELCKDRPNILHADLRLWLGAMRHSNCKQVVGTASGGLNCAQVFSSAPMTIYDVNSNTCFTQARLADSPFFFGPPFRFSTAPIKFRVGPHEAEAFATLLLQDLAKETKGN
jgi:hypothetical protein